MSATPATAVTRTLGYAGLIPFMVPAIYSWTGNTHLTLAIDFAGIYALVILCFISGSWWGMGRGSHSPAALLISNLYLLLALALYLLAGHWWPLAAALLLVGAWIFEQTPRLFAGYERSYRNTRALLTLMAAASMFVLQMAAVNR